MFAKLKSLFRNKDHNDTWMPPGYWQNEVHMSAYDRQQKSAARHRERIARAIGMY